jgi:MerR HTH family regulatory protein
MENEHLIPADELCTHYNLEISFINALQETGLIEITAIEENYFINADQLQKVEQFARWYYELDINLEGIEVIDQMLQRIRNMQDEITYLQNRLRLFNESNRRTF